MGWKAFPKYRQRDQLKLNYKGPGERGWGQQQWVKREGTDLRPIKKDVMMREWVMYRKMPEFPAWMIGSWRHSNPRGKMQFGET